ncbi:hypothetical protein PAMP_014200 [Pampus punctatissimus]
MGRSADNQVNEKESHLEQRGVSMLISCRCPSLSASSTQRSEVMARQNNVPGAGRECSSQTSAFPPADLTVQQYSLTEAKL